MAERPNEEELGPILAELIRGTPVEGDERELARLEALPPKERLEVGIVLKTAKLREGDPRRTSWSDRLGRVRTVADAQRVLGRPGPQGVGDDVVADALGEFDPY